MTAYLFISQKRVTAESRTYQVVNLLGAIAIGINVGYHGAWPALGLQVVWGMIALYEVLKH